MAFGIGEDLLSDEQKLKIRFKNRNRLGIVANILTIAKQGALKTHLMYKANLSYTMLRDYLRFLLDNGLLTESRYAEDKITLFRTTEKGTRFLDSYSALKDLASPIIDRTPFASSTPVEHMEKTSKNQPGTVF